MLKEADLKQNTFDLETAQENLSELVKEIVGNKRKTIIVNGEPAVMLVSVEHYQKMRQYMKELEAFVEEAEEVELARAAREAEARIASGEDKLVPWAQLEAEWEAEGEPLSD